MNDDFDSNIIVTPGEHPRLMVLFIREVISPETIIIMDRLTEFFKYWNKVLGDDIVWPDVYKKLKKYQPFFINSVDLSKYRSYTMEHFG